MDALRQHSHPQLEAHLLAMPRLGPRWAKLRHSQRQGHTGFCHRPSLCQHTDSAWQVSRRRSAQLHCQALSNGNGASSSFRVTLSSDELAALSFGDARQGENGYCIVVTEVEPSSRAEQAGIRERQKLLAISSPMQSGEMWPLNDKPSLRFVREAIGRLRRTPSVDLEFSREPVPLEAEREPSQTPVLQSSLMQGVEDAQAGEAPTVAERLATAYEQNEKTAFQEQSLRARRIKRRKDYLEAESNRNDTPLILGLLAAFILPSLCILIYAFSSGYLDRLASNYTRF